MKLNQTVVALFNVAVFAAAGLLLYLLLRGGHATVAPQSEADEDHHENALVSVRVGAIERGTVHRILTAYGQVEPAPASTTQPAASARVGVPVSELVSELLCAEGDHVSPGQALFRLDTRPADATIAQDQALTTAAQSVLDTLHRIQTPSVPDWALAAAQWERDWAQATLDRARTELRWRTVASPISGTVTALNIRTGQVADASTAAVEIVDTARLVAALDVPGFDATSVHAGQHVILDVPTRGSSTRPSASDGSIVRIDPMADISSGMVSADVSLPPDCGLWPGQFLRGRVEIETHDNCLIVPADAIVNDADAKPRIALIQGTHRAYFQNVVIGIRQGDRVEIAAEPNSPPFEQGQNIVIGGADALPRGGCNIEASR
jgi:membrane fusion protein (multidrug efflux system)